MSYFDDYFGPSNDYVKTWFDPDEGGPPPSANGGSSKARILGTLTPRPQVPPWRLLKDHNATGMMVTEIRNYLNELDARPETFGNHIEVVFANTTTAVRVDTGLGGPVKGYKIVTSNGDIRVYTSSPPTGVDPTPERGIVWLRAAYDVSTLPAGVQATVTLYVY